MIDHVWGCEHNDCNKCVALSEEENETEHIINKHW